MIVFSAFNGMTCGRIALERLNIPVEKYYSSEIDKWAIQVTQDIYPDTIQLGDIENWREWDIDWSTINIAIAGSPCQGFSNAGKGLNFEDPRSKLFFVWIDILNHIKEANPEVIFLLENVIMKKAWQKIISDYMGLFPVQINAALVSAQNRDRLYWTNIRTKDVGLFSENWTDIPQPKDRGIVLRDIIQPESEIGEKYFNNKRLNSLIDKRLIIQHGVHGYDFRHDEGLRHRDGHKSGTLQAQARQDGTANQVLISVKGILRRATPIECERLQGVPDNYTDSVSDTQRYKMLGNGWQCDVIEWIFRFLK